MIPKPLLKRLLADKRNSKCCVCGKEGTELHHVFTGQGRKNINEVWSIVGLCPKCHRGSFGTISKEVKERAEYESIMRLMESGFENLDKYQKPMDKTWPNRINWYLNHYKK